MNANNTITFVLFDPDGEKSTMSMSNTIYSVHTADSISPTQMHRSKPIMETNHYYSPQNGFSGNPYTNSLLNELNAWQKQHRATDDRSRKEEKTYCDVEYALIEKCERYSQRFERKLASLIRCYPEAANVDVVETIDRIVDLETRIAEMKEVIHAKRWYEDRNQFYRKLVEQQMLRENIDGLTQKIRYFEQLVLNHVHKMKQDGKPMSVAYSKFKVAHAAASQAPSDEDNVVSIVTPFVVKEALRIRAENEKELNNLRDRLDEIRKNRQ